MNKKYYILFAIVVIISYATGRYMSPQKVKTEIKTVEVEKIVTKVQHQTIHIRDNKDGTKDTIIVTDTTTGEHSKENTSSTNKEVTVRNTLNVSVLGGISLPLSPPVIGVSVQKNLLGPITFGLWGLSNATIGASVGINL